MIYLDERQVGFDATRIGFPSIDGCHAVALQTETGLFGIHCLGGERAPEGNDMGWDSRALAFGTFYNGHPRKSNGVHLYSVCFRTGKRGYTPSQFDNWRKEMKAHAKKLGYKGPVSGFDLTTVTAWPDGSSAYVEMRLVFGQVHVGYKPWTEITKQGCRAADLPDRFNRRTSGTAGDVKEITFGNNHTVGVASNPGTNDLKLVLDAEWDTFNV